MTKDFRVVHSGFKLNGLSYSKADLKALTYDLVKEGKPYQQEIGAFLLDWLDAEETLQVKTSGSTGTPKTIVLQKRQMVNSALATGSFFNLKPTNSALLCLPASYIAGKMMLVRALVLGLHLDCVSPGSSPLVAVSKKYAFCAMVPLQLENSLGQLDTIKTLLVGGAPVSKTLKAQLQNVKTAVFETYGMTETITHIAVKQINKATAATNLFKALPNVVLSQDERGCLVIKAPKVANEIVVTNDMVQLVSEKEFMWLGRFDNVINSGGVKLFPEQIEEKLKQVITNRFFVSGLPHAQLGQRLVVVVEGEVATDALLQKITKLASLEKFEIPKAVYKLSKFSETESGKIRRKENIQLIQE